MASEWRYLPFTEAVEVNPRVRLGRGTRYPFVDMKAIDPSWKDVTESEYREFKSGGAKFEPFDTLMARITPCLENGKIARYVPKGELKRPAFGSTEFIVIRGKEGVTNNDFAYYLTKWQEFRQFAISQMAGTSGRQRVPVDALGGFNVPVPDLSEQRAIAHILGSLDDKIELNRRMNETLETMAQAMFKSWFIDFDPVIDNALATGNTIPDELREQAELRTSLGDARKSLPEDIRKLFPSEFELTEELGWIPKGWTAKKLGQTIHLFDNIRIPLSKHQRLERHGSFRYFGATGVMDYVNDYLFDGVYALVGEDGTVQTSSGKPVVQYVWGQFWVNNHAHVLQGNGISTEHLITILKSIDIRKYITGAVQPKLNQMNLKSIPIVAATDGVNKYFEKHIEHLFLKTRMNTDNSSDLEKTRDVIMPNLLSGKIRPPEMEKLLEGKI